MNCPISFTCNAQDNLRCAVLTGQIIEGMMRQLEKHLREPIDPWAFARTRRFLNGVLPIGATREIRQLSNGKTDIDFTLQGAVDKNGRHRLRGTLEVALTLVCQRCLAPIEWPLVHVFEYVLIRDAAEENAVEKNDETLICAGRQLDLAWFLEEEVLLLVPMTVKHDKCAPPAHTEDEQLPASSRDNPFASLAALKNLIKHKEH